jgi:hypothetical protein
MAIFFVFLFLAGVVVVVLWDTSRRDFVVRYEAGRFTCRGRLAQPAALEQFLRDDLCVAGPLEISGRRHGGRLSLWFKGRLTPGEAQRIRNFLLTHR